GVFRIGTVVSIGFFGVFGGWAALAPLSSAAIAPGVVSPEGSRRVVQHLEGGIVAAIDARDGDRVEAGAPLVRLEETLSKSVHGVLLTERASLAALAARLRAERDGAAAPEFPAWLVREADAEPRVAAILDHQRTLFDTRGQIRDGETGILRAKADELRQERDGVVKQIESQGEQRRLLDEQIADTQTLLDEGLARRPRLLELQREAAAIDERVAGNETRRATLETRIREADLQIAAADAARRDAVSAELVDTVAKLAAADDRLAASGDVLERTVVAAPTAGVVMASRVKTIGAVVKPGAPIMEIVPDEEELIVEARVAPNDVDVVSPGLDATVLFPGLSQRGLPTLKGEVIAVSADAVVGEEAAPYYVAKVRVAPESRAALGARQLTPGMAAEVQILTGARTTLQYLLEPLSGVLRRGMREG
ncbi:MAG: HlyD family type I secretion periplasmic adaptor subunit, partial [Pseudomonadota bacterium]